MSDYPTMERQFSENLRLERRPVAVTFRETPPPGIAKFTGTVPSGCSFWACRRRPDLLHRSERPLQLSDRVVHA